MSKEKKKITETRKVQETGRNSYVITLPKEWITTQNIKKNQDLRFLYLNNGDLLITSKTKKEPYFRQKKISIINQNFDSIKFLRHLFGSYIAGFSQIILTTDERITSNMREDIKKFRDATIGTETLEKSESLLIIRDLLQPKEVDLQENIAQMTVLVRSMHKDAMEALKTKNKALAKSVINRDLEINRNSNWITHQMSKILHDSTLLFDIDIPLINIQIYFIMSVYLELIGDTAVKIANDVLLLLETDFPEKYSHEITLLSETAMELLSKSIKAWESKDEKIGHACFDTYQLFKNECQELLTRTSKIAASYIGPFYLIIDHIQNTGKIVSNLALLAIDQAIDE